MAQELKEWFNPAFFRDLGGRLRTVCPAFDAAGFASQAARGLDRLSLTQRMTATAEAARVHLPQDFRIAVEILKQVAPAYRGQFAGMFMCEFVATYGQDDRDYALAALADLTRHFSAEFAVRHFLVADFDHTIGLMTGWAGDPDPHVRRLASEGSRPRLPWSFNLNGLIEDPSPVRPILDRLNRDPAAAVRKSVANHLNDISKDHPDLMLDWVSAWDLSDPHSAWIAKHAARSLIKQGDQRAFGLFGFAAAPELTIEGFRIRPRKVVIGEDVTMSFTLASASRRDQKLAVDYAVHFIKKSGKTSPKVFKLKELVLAGGERRPLTQRHRFVDRTIRTHHAGEQRIELMVNGRVMASGAVLLVRV